MASVLVVEDKDSLRELIVRVLSDAGHEVAAAGSGEDAVAAFEKKRSDVVVCDFRLPGMDGISVLDKIKEGDPRAEVVLMTAFGSVEDAVRAMKKGAFDFLTKPVDNDHLLFLVEKAVERRRLVSENLVLRERAADRLEAPQMLGESAAHKAALAMAKKVASSDATVMLTGESGTGKELFARYIHHQSPRASGPFIPINCSAIPETLLESELFGHEKGSFTGAVGRHLGRAELAQGGTLFLDEIGEMPATIQVKLLRFLQEKSFERVGGGKPIRADVRIVAATNRNLAAAVKEGSFREDFFFRLNVFPVHVPPLRERREDIPLLAEHFARRYAAAAGKEFAAIRPATISSLQRYDWPGNVRELENVIERAVILSDGKVLEFSLSDVTNPAPDASASPPAGPDGIVPLKEAGGKAAAEAERTTIRRALDKTEGNKMRASKLLQVSYKTLLNRMKDLGMG